ncbi:hypothetical protein BDQ12DRAFT_615973 [Crucibulum laeve]|uniref:Peptidase M43 pregnancy-associated plasma-A domain-containing protein n=1 Tax=Crucibulum laeve TaxID=68775 RepID=A0A5C3LW90_9AGAR|nr:hypothetical protein BDQ12DRAFT_615973 [Crucibulum laeve]
MTFDVYWNVVAANETYEGGWIPDSHIDAQMKVLNDDYSSSGFTWKHVNTTRIVSADWFENASGSQQEDSMKYLFRKGGATTLNIYTIGFNATTKTLGLSTLPANYTSAPKSDGIILRYTTLPGGSLKNYNGGRTLTHELGHWLGLLHTFTDGCEGTGDFVDDTPPEKSAASGCPANRDTCPGGGPDPIHNFMDYTYDSCMSEFTKGQVKRMHEMVQLFRAGK